MERPYDRLAKDTLRQVLLAASRTLVPEHEVAAEAQRLDLWCIPDPEKLEVLAPFGLLRRIAEQGPIALDLFHEAPSLDDVLRSLRKALYLRHPACLPPSPDEPWLWIVAGGRPTGVIVALALEVEAGWPPGIYTASAGFRLRLVVTSELPATPNTLLLRAFGAGRTLTQAIRELRANGLEHPLGAVMLPLMVRLHLERRDGPQDQESKEFLMETQDIYETWHQRVLAEGKAEGKAEGRAEGEAKAILAILEARGLAVSDVERSRVLGSTDLEELDRWVRRAVSVERAAQLFE